MLVQGEWRWLRGAVKLSLSQGGELQNSRDSGSRGEAAASEKVSPWAREGVCFTIVLQTVQIVLGTIRGALETSPCTVPFSFKDRGRGHRPGLQGWGGEGRTSPNRGGKVSGARDHPPRQETGAHLTHPRQGQGHWRFHLEPRQRNPLIPDPCCQCLCLN